jgi:fatty acid desaturase
MHSIIRNREIVARSLRVASTTEWPTIMLIAACYVVWISAGLLYTAAPALAVVVLAITIVLHASLQHEAIHRHPTSSARLNEALVWLPLGLLVPYRRFRDLHLLHHDDARLTDPYDDPESFYRGRCEWDRLPYALQRLLTWNNILAVRLLIGPAIQAAIFLWTEAKALVRPADGQAGGQLRRTWALHITGLVTVGLIVKFVFHMPLGSYLLATYLAQAVLALRSYCEHQWAERVEARTVIVENSVLGFLFLNNNLHVVHHAHPALPWYALPSAYRARRDQWEAINGGYVFNGYGAVLRKFAFCRKEPVSHPARTNR